MERAETIRLAREGTFPEHIDKKYLKILKKYVQKLNSKNCSNVDTFLIFHSKCQVAAAM